MTELQRATGSEVRPVRVLLVDDHPLVRDALSMRLSADPGIDVSGTAASASEAVRVAIALVPDVVLMDIDMPGRNCFDAGRSILAAHPLAGLIFLSAHITDEYIESALGAGALGYVTKAEPCERIVYAILEVAAGRAFFSDAVRSRLLIGSGEMQLAKHHCSRISTLSQREREVLGYIAKGLSTKEIASILHLSTRTVDNHRNNLMRKLDIHDRVNLARFAIREGLVEP